jgi:uncharacterized protein
VVHLELRTADASGACAFYRQLLGWRAEVAHLGSGSYVCLALGSLIEGGVVEEDRSPAAWLPYVEVTDVDEAVQRAALLGATIALEPREGPTGWRSVIVAPDGAETALWQPRRAGIRSAVERRS